MENSQSNVTSKFDESLKKSELRVTNKGEMYGKNEQK